MVLDKVIEELELEADAEHFESWSDDDCSDEDECEDEPKYEKGQRGYTAEQVVRVLETYKCKSRMLDYNLKQFLTCKKDLKVDKNLSVFVAIVYANHLYYCDDPHFVKCLGGKVAAQEARCRFERFPGCQQPCRGACCVCCWFEVER